MAASVCVSTHLPLHSVIAQLPPVPLDVLVLDALVVLDEELPDALVLLDALVLVLDPLVLLVDPEVDVEPAPPVPVPA